MTILSFRRFFSAAIRVSLRSNVCLPSAKWPWNWARSVNACHTLQKSVTRVPLVVYRRELYGLLTFSHPDFMAANRVLPVDLGQAPRVDFQYMRTRASIIAGGIALAICLLCPLVDLFDQWDHALQTGNDTEYPLVILALCVGAAFVLGRLLVTLSPNFSLSGVRYTLQSALSSLPDLNRPTALALASASPPLSLRI